MNPRGEPKMNPPDQPSIDLGSDEYFMGEALRQAAQAYEAGEIPVGAVVVRDGRIIARAFNQVELLRDATAHAEMLAITAAEAAVGDWRLTGTTIFVTKEPCPMCAAAMALARVKRCVFGAFDPKCGGAASRHNLLAESGLNHRVEERGGVLEQKSRALLQDFFVQARSKLRHSNP
jgi:tRNA(adenine34) deaminase